MTRTLNVCKCDVFNVDSIDAYIELTCWMSHAILLTYMASFKMNAVEQLRRCRVYVATCKASVSVKIFN